MKSSYSKKTHDSMCSETVTTSWRLLRGGTMHVAMYSRTVYQP